MQLNESFWTFFKVQINLWLLVSQSERAYYENNCIIPFPVRIALFTPYPERSKNRSGTSWSTFYTGARSARFSLRSERFKCEQKAYPVWFSRRNGSFPVWCEHGLNVLSQNRLPGVNTATVLSVKSWIRGQIYWRHDSQKLSMNFHTPFSCCIALSISQCLPCLALQYQILLQVPQKWPLSSNDS